MPYCHVVLKAPRPLPTAYPKYLDTLGDHLRKKRLDLGLLQREVAVQIGVDESTIWNWESNATQPALPMRPKVIGFLGYAPYVPACTLVEKLAFFRRTRGVSIKQLAADLGVDPSTLAHCESGRYNPARKYLEKIEDFFGAH